MNEEKVFKDPIHQYIYVQDNLIWDLINTKEFQRLRRIKQLGTSYLTYHGAEHSRFSHSLGVYEIARKIIFQFERNNYKGFSKEENLISMVAALLHDIGHGPFSHSTEKTFGYNHETWTEKIILENTEVNYLLKQFDSNLPNQIVSVIKKTYSNSIVTDLISSQLDADRMDYLLRDAYYTGVNYGTFDLERILRVLRPYNNMLVVKETGMHSIEDYLMSRYQMYWQVYFHPVTRSAEILLKKLFLRARYLYENNYKFLFMLETIKKLFNTELTCPMSHSPKGDEYQRELNSSMDSTNIQQGLNPSLKEASFNGDLDVREYLRLDDNLFITLINYWTEEEDFILSDLASRFINRKLFKYTDFKIENYEKIKKISDFLNSNGIDSRYYLEIDSPSDLPYDIYHPETVNKISPIYLLTQQNNIIEISKKSDIIKSITGKRVTMHRIFYPADILNKKSLNSQFESLVRENLC